MFGEHQPEASEREQMASEPFEVKYEIESIG